MNKRIKICYIINSFEVGGAETVALDLASKHDIKKYDVTVAAILEKPHNLDSIMLNRYQERDVKTVSFVQGSFKSFKALWSIYYFFKKNKFDIVHAHNRPADMWSMRIAKFANVPLFLWTRHLVYQDMSQKQIRAYQNLSKSSGPILAVSDAVRDYCIAIEGIEKEKVRTIVNGINTDRFSPIETTRKNQVRQSLNLQANEHMLLFVGRMNQQKAPESFIDLMNELQSKGLPVRGFMCGHGPLAENITNLIKTNSTCIEMLGLRDDIPELLASCDLFISTSRNEGLPLNVMEAMSAGTAFVAPAIEQIACLMEGHPELKQCLSTPPPLEGAVMASTVKSWADTTELLLANPEKMEEVGRKARNVIKNSYSLEKMILNYEAVFDEFLNK